MRITKALQIYLTHRIIHASRITHASHADLLIELIEADLLDIEILNLQSFNKIPSELHVALRLIQYDTFNSTSEVYTTSDTYVILEDQSIEDKLQVLKKHK